MACIRKAISATSKGAYKAVSKADTAKDRRVSVDGSAHRVRGSGRRKGRTT